MFKDKLKKYMVENYSTCPYCLSLVEKNNAAMHSHFHRINNDKTLLDIASLFSNSAGVHTQIFPSSSSAEPKEMEEQSFYCVYCKEKVYTNMYRIKVSDSGRRMAQGNCPRCNGKINRILGKEN